MIIDDLQSSRDEDRVTSSARLRWARGEFRLEVTMPAEFAPGRPTHRRSSASRCCSRCGWASTSTSAAPCRPRCSSEHRRSSTCTRAGTGPCSGPAFAPRRSSTRRRAPTDTACFLSRGVDSLYSATTPREGRPAITHFVFCDRLEPMHSEAVRAEELRIAGEAAERLGLPLVPIETNIRALTTPIVHNWEDMVGAALAFFGTSMSGGLGHVVIPSSDGPQTIGPCGTSQLLDPLFSTAEVELEYDAPGTRTEKVAWLARERAELLPFLKVCFFEDRVDNCGRCSKCLLTMLALEAAGALDRASAFAPEIDREALGEVRIRGSQPETEYREVERALRASGKEELAALVTGGLERAAAATVDPRVPADSPNFRKRADMRARRERAKPFGAPRTTVMMPCYEAETMLRGAVDSVLSQTVGDLELVVVDDGSTVPVAEVLEDIRDPRLRIIRHAGNRGLSAARNTALAAARAPLVSQLDADDLWEPEYLESVLPGSTIRVSGSSTRTARSSATRRATRTTSATRRSTRSTLPQDRRAEPGAVPHGHDARGRRARGGGLRDLAAAVRGLPPVHEARARGLALRLRPRAARPVPLARAGPQHELRRPAARGVGARDVRLVRAPPSAHARAAPSDPRSRAPGARPGARRGGRRLPRPLGGRPRLLVEPGSYAMLNLGDVAMLQVCVERLRELWPGALIRGADGGAGAARGALPRCRAGACVRPARVVRAPLGGRGLLAAHPGAATERCGAHGRAPGRPHPSCRKGRSARRAVRARAGERRAAQLRRLAAERRRRGGERPRRHHGRLPRRRPGGAPGASHRDRPRGPHRDVRPGARPHAGRAAARARPTGAPAARRAGRARAPRGRAAAGGPRRWGGARARGRRRRARAGAPAVAQRRLSRCDRRRAAPVGVLRCDG